MLSRVHINMQKTTAACAVLNQIMCGICTTCQTTIIPIEYKYKLKVLDNT